MPDRRRFPRVAARALSVALLVALAGGASAPASAQGAASRTDQEARQLLDDFAHFVYIRNDDLAAAYAQAILDLGLTPMEFVAVVEDDPRLRERFEETARRALVIDAVEPAAAQLRTLFEEGQLERARDPEQIARNIQLLTGNPRARLVARERLAFAGEYAVPQLLQVLMARADQVLESEVQRLLIEMGAKAAMPLLAAMPKVDEESQRRIAFILGQAQVRSALPFLYELNASPTVTRDTKRVVERAINGIDGGPNPSANAADLFLDLAETFYREQASLTRFPGESHQLIWEFDPGFGLFPTALRTEVFHEAMAMRLAEHALSLGAGERPATAVWLAANFSREIDSPAEYENPVYPDDRRGATYYAVAAGPSLTADVLTRALRDRDTPLVRRAIEALAQTSGGATDWRNSPLVEALSYPDRRVQYEAALAIAKARPTSSFSAADRVVPTLAAAIREADARFALVIASELENQQSLSDDLRSIGYTVLAPAASLGEAQTAIAEAPGVDLVVSQLSAAATSDLLRDVRGETKLRVTPVLAVVAGAASGDLATRFADDTLVRIARAGISAAQFGAAAEALAFEATGPAISPADAERYAGEALSALRDLAVAGSPTLDVTVAARPLVAVFEEGGPLAIVLGDLLASIPAAEAQRALGEAALASSGTDRVSYLRLTARSVREFASMLERRQVNRLIDLAGDASLPEAEAVAVAALVGSLDLDVSEGGRLILDAP